MCPEAIVNWDFTGNGNYNDQSGSVAIEITPTEATCEVSGYAGVYDAVAHGASGTCAGIDGEEPGTLDLGDTFVDVPGGTAPWTFTGNGNYNDQSGSVLVEITPTEATCEVSGYTGVYDAVVHGAAGTCTGIDGEEPGTLDLGNTFVNVPGGTAEWTFTGNGNYNDQSGSVAIEITPAEATCDVSGYSGVYDAAAHGASGTCTGIDGEEPGTLDLGDTFVDVPGGTALWTFTGNGNYNDQSGSVLVEITPAEATCDVSGYSGVYDAAAHGASGTCTGIDGEEPGTLDLGNTFVNVPGGTAEWTFTGNGNYNDQSGSVVIEITPAEATCEVSGYSGVYDAEYHGAWGSCTGVAGEIPGDLDLGLTFKDVPGGTALWTFTGNGNYNDQSGSVLVEITPAEATCDVSGYSVVYDAAAHGASGTCTGIDAENPGVLDLGNTFVNVPGGTALWTFTGNGNYNDQSGSVLVEITPAEATCEVNGFSGVYDVAAHGASGTCTGIGGENPGVLDLGNTYINVPGGTARWTFTGNGNYNDQSGEVAIEITPAEATCEVSGYSGVYDAAAHGASGTCTGIDGENPGVLDLGNTFVDVPGGTAEWTFTGNGNYNDQSGSVAIVITPAEATCEVSGYSGVYDAVAHGASGTCAGIGGENPGVLDLGNTFVNVPGGTARWTFTGNGNYNDQSGEVAIVINQADPTCEVTGYSLEYDREAHTASGFLFRRG